MQHFLLLTIKYLFVLDLRCATQCHNVPSDVTAIAVAVIAIAVERRIIRMEGRTLPEKSQRYFKSRRQKKEPFGSFSCSSEQLIPVGQVLIAVEVLAIWIPPTHGFLCLLAVAHDVAD